MNINNSPVKFNGVLISKNTGPYYSLDFQVVPDQIFKGIKYGDVITSSETADRFSKMDPLAIHMLDNSKQQELLPQLIQDSAMTDEEKNEALQFILTVFKQGKKFGSTTFTPHQGPQSCELSYNGFYLDRRQE